MVDELNEIGYEIYNTKNSNVGLVIFTGICSIEENGYEYCLEIAKNSRIKFKTRVFIFKVECWDEFDKVFLKAMKVVDSFFKKRYLFNYDIYIMGIYAGANIAIAFSCLWKNIKKVLAVNPILKMNYNKLLDGMEMSQSEINIVIGDKDDSYSLLPILKSQINKVNLEILKGVDHNFSSETSLLLALPDLLLFD